MKNESVKAVVLTGLGVAVGVALLYGAYSLYVYASKKMATTGTTPAPAVEPGAAAAAAAIPSREAASLKKVA